MGTACCRLKFEDDDERSSLVFNGKHPPKLSKNDIKNVKKTWKHNLATENEIDMLRDSLMVILGGYSNYSEVFTKIRSNTEKDEEFRNQVWLIHLVQSMKKGFHDIVSNLSKPRVLQTHLHHLILFHGNLNNVNKHQFRRFMNSVYTLATMSVHTDDRYEKLEKRSWGRFLVFLYHNITSQVPEVDDEPLETRSSFHHRPLTDTPDPSKNIRNHMSDSHQDARENRSSYIVVNDK